MSFSKAELDVTADKSLLSKTAGPDTSESTQNLLSEPTRASNTGWKVAASPQGLPRFNYQIKFHHQFHARARLALRAP
jgi:hypothetical protein